MAVIALIQDQFPTLNTSHAGRLSGFEKQLYQKFFEVLVEESGHDVQRAESLQAYQSEDHSQKPDMVICAPFPERGNLAPGFAELARIMDAFPDTPVIVWTTRQEEAVRTTVLDDHNAAEYYTGTLLEAPDDFADMILKYV